MMDVPSSQTVLSTPRGIDHHPKLMDVFGNVEGLKTTFSAAIIRSLNALYIHNYYQYLPIGIA